MWKFVGIPFKAVVVGRNAFLLWLIILCCSPMLTASAAHMPLRFSHIGAMNSFLQSRHVLRWMRKSPPLDSDCRAQLHISCFSPDEMQNAYSETPLLRAGFDGKGQTIVIVDSFGSPTLNDDLHHFDKDYGLPDPPSLKIYSPLGTVPFDVNNQDMVGWAQETNLDVQWAHALAPGASIVLLTSPVSETEGIQGMPEFRYLLSYALDHKLGEIISQSWGTAEETLFDNDGKGILNSFNTLYQRAASQHVTVLAAAGDNGCVNVDVNNHSYTFPTVLFPAASPWVTAVGGTTLRADTNGNYQSEVVWNSGNGSASGGGYSKYFLALRYQKGLPQALHFRGVPDIAYDADTTTGVPVYLGFMPHPDYYYFGGTSAGAPQWAGLIALANQMAGHPLGNINDALYSIGEDANLAPHAFHDITSGNNTQGNVTGYQAAPGWDPITGWGTPDASFLLPTLIQVHDQR